MSPPARSPILQLIRRFVTDENIRQLSDQRLLQQFCDLRCEATFETLIRRHGSMVFHVCRSVLSNEADAEDAFQATFLILARKAASIRKTASVASWLHRIAHRSALKARAQSATRKKKEARTPDRPVSKPDDLAWREVQQILHEELNGLSERYRGPLIACYLEGKTQKEAARQLGVALSTLKERLERGRLLLQSRLVRRGVGSAAILVAATWPASSSASVPVTLVSNTIKATSAFIAGQTNALVASAEAMALTEGILKTMMLTKLKLATVALVGMAVLGSTAGMTMYASTSPTDEPTTRKLPIADGRGSVKPFTARVLHLPKDPYHYADVELPAKFTTEAGQIFDHTPADNPVTDEGATLGRVLFYDTRLSANNTVSCSSCHAQKNAFADSNRASKGFEGKQTDRHALSLANVRWSGGLRGHLFWDERARTLEEAVLVPIQSKTEMGQDLSRLPAILAKDTQYAGLFRKAFNDGQITQERIAKALAQFLRSMATYQSRYDEGLAKARSVEDDFTNFTVQENRGKALFMNSCAKCHLHGDVHFVMGGPTNNGLDADYQNTDGGLGDITLKATDIGRFKSASLRNIEVSAPYMHDGRFDTLEKVIDHYSKEVKSHPNLDPKMRDLNAAPQAALLAGRDVTPRRLNFTDSEKAALVAFLKTLTDLKFLSDQKFSDPFQ